MQQHNPQAHGISMMPPPNIHQGPMGMGGPPRGMPMGFGAQVYGGGMYPPQQQQQFPGMMGGGGGFPQHQQQGFPQQQQYPPRGPMQGYPYQQQQQPVGGFGFPQQTGMYPNQQQQRW